MAKKASKSAWNRLKELLECWSWVEWTVVGLVLVGTAIRFWNLDGALMFQGDQGRDALIVADIFRKLDPVFIGPVTSVGNMYLGPLYYYFMLPFLWLSYPSPMGPVYAVAALGSITIALMYVLGKELVGKHAALIATFLFTFSQVVVTYTRFSWNPNPAPLVSLIMIWATYRAYTKNKWYWVLVGLCFSIVMQLHYLILLSAGGAGLVWLFALGREIKTKQFRLSWLVPSFAAAGVYLASLTPLMLFDAKHNWLNVKALQNLVFGENNFKVTDSVSPLAKITETVMETHGRSLHIFFEHSIGQNRLLNTILLVCILLTVAWIVFKQVKHTYRTGILVVMAYLITGVFGTALYQHTIFDHYIAYLFPVAFLIIGVWLQFWLSRKTLMVVGVPLTIFFTGLFLSYNLPRLPLQDTGWTIADMQVVTDSIAQRLSPGEKYNLVLLSESGDIDGQNYRYFLSTSDTPALPQDRRGEAETLVIINEDMSIDRVVDSPIYEIVVFPNKQPAEVYTSNGGPEITILRKNQEQ